jgi:hypothetical protein
VKPSEPSSPGESDIRPVEADVTSTSDSDPSENSRWRECVLPSLVLPDTARQFSVFEALIVLGCCTACLSLALLIGGLVDTRDTDIHRLIGRKFICGPICIVRVVRPLSPHDLVFNFLLGLAPACPLILLNQYLLRGRRSWPKITEWVWLWSALTTLVIFETALPISYRDAIRGFIPESATEYYRGLSLAIPFAWLTVHLFALPGWSTRATWTDWLEIVSVPCLIVVLGAWIAGRFQGWP